MIKYLYLLIALLAFLSCKKTTNVTNNIPVSNYPGFTVQGLSDINLSRNSYAQMSMSVVYHDSIQEKVTLEFSPLPAGVVLADNWIKSGYPTFSNSLLFLDTNVLNPAIPGTYPMTLKATGSQSGLKTYSFNIAISDIPSVSDAYIGVYPNCTITGTSVHYIDTIVKDAAITNKVWFKNFGNTGKTVAAIFNANATGVATSITIPPQKADTINVSGSGTINTSGTATYRIRCFTHINSASINFTM